LVELWEHFLVMAGLVEVEEEIEAEMGFPVLV
jgi:hypothetical protein